MTIWPNFLTNYYLVNLFKIERAEEKKGGEQRWKTKNNTNEIMMQNCAL